MVIRRLLGGDWADERRSGPRASSIVLKRHWSWLLQKCHIVFSSRPVCGGRACRAGRKSVGGRARACKVGRCGEEMAGRFYLRVVRVELVEITLPERAHAIVDSVIAVGGGEGEGELVPQEQVS